MTIDELNAASADVADPVLRACVDLESWVTALLDARPYLDAATLFAAATEQAASWTEAEVEVAIRDHPRIGERPSADSPTAELSRREQAAMAGAEADLEARLRAGNAAYEERFGRIYLVRAAGRSADELVEILEQRLGNDPDLEALETKRQLAEIAVLRLRALMTQDGP